MLSLAIPLLAGAFILQGQLLHYSDKPAVVYFENDDDLTVADTIHFDPNGHFYLKTEKCTHPQEAVVVCDSLQFSIDAAPGYRLTIGADATNGTTLFQSYTVTGIGATSNRYRHLKDSLESLPLYTIAPFESNEDTLRQKVTADMQLRDSLIHAVFDKGGEQDNYNTYFRNSAVLDNQFNRLYHLLSFIEDNHLTPQKRKELLTGQSFEHIDDPVNLSSPMFRNWICASAYLRYVMKLDAERDTSLKQNTAYLLNKIIATYSGPVRAYVLHAVLSMSTATIKSLDRLKRLAKTSGPYLDYMDTAAADDITLQMKEKEKILSQIREGITAPEFTLRDSTGRQYSLLDFRGKVVYIDFWASWCGPCRRETLFMKRLHEQYPDTSRIVFIGIDVRDAEKSWRQALFTDAPAGIQLFDEQETVANTFDAIALPKFMIIDKRGVLVNANAPRPDDPASLTPLLDKCIAQ